MTNKEINQITQLPITTPEEGFYKLRQLFRVLRDQGKGCPWDLKQDLNSIKNNLIEEAYEFFEALENVSEDPQSVDDELGDLYLVLAFYSQMLSEKRNESSLRTFKLVTEKIIRRHPHIFTDSADLSPDEVQSQWDQIKQQEKDKHSHQSIFHNVPKGLSGLAKAMKVQKKAAKTGFDWDNSFQVIDKIREELDELEEELRNPSINQENIRSELSDVFFSVINLARFMEFDPETLVQQSVKKFQKRFSYIEKQFTQEGLSLSKENLKRMEFFWEEAKRKE